MWRRDGEDCLLLFFCGCDVARAQPRVLCQQVRECWCAVFLVEDFQQVRRCRRSIVSGCMGITRPANCRVDVVDMCGVEFFGSDAARRCDDCAGRSDVVRVGVARFARPNSGEDNLRNCGLAFVFGLLALMLVS